MNDISVQAMRRLSTAGGVEMPAMDLSKPLSEPEKQLIRDAFLEHHILVFRNQKLERAQAAFTEQFGELEDHVVRQHDGSKTPQVHTVSNLDADGKPSYKPLTHGNYFWHTDKSYHAKPSLATLLHAIELPTEGGNTQFAIQGLPGAAGRTQTGLRRLEGCPFVGGQPAQHQEQTRDRGRKAGTPAGHPSINTDSSGDG